MPAALPAIIVAVTGSAAAATAISAVVIALARQAALTFLARVLSKKPGQGAPPINVTLRATVVERRICLGTVRAGGAVLFVNTSGTKNKYLWIVVAYAGHQCSDVKDLWLDKYKIPDADINAGTGAVSTTQMDGKLFCWTYLGTSAQTADANLDAAFTEWTTNHRLRGICYRVLRLERSTDAWPNGAPQSFTSLVDGALSYDPRLDTTAGGAGTHRSNDPSTWAFTRNWALNTRWVLSGGSVINDDTTRLIKYGVRESDSRIDDAYITAAANLSDQSLSGGNAPPSGAQPRYTLDIELSCGQTRREWLEECLAAGGPGQLVYIHGKWRLYGAAYDAPSHTMTQDDLVDELEDDCTSGSEDRFNQITATYIDETKDWTAQTTPIRTNATYVTQDNSEKILHPAVLRGVSNEYRAQRVIELMLRRARQMRVVKLPFGRQGMKIAPWETFTFDHTAFGWSGRVFRCVERELVRNETGGLICMITAQAEASSVYTDLVTADYTTGTSVTNSLQSEPPDEPTSLVATSITRAIEFTWTLGAFWAQNGISELWEYTANTPFASATKIWEGRSNRVVIQKPDLTTRYYWVRIRTIGGQTSSTEPSGNGLAGVAADDPAAIPDPTFALSTGQTFWVWYNAYLGGTTASGVSISATGGVSAGRLILVGDSTVKAVFSRRTTPYRVITGQILRGTYRWRRTGSLSSASGTDVVFGAVIGSTFSDAYVSAPADIVGSGGSNLDRTTVNAVTVNQWQETTFTVTITNHPKASTQAPYALIYLFMDAACTGGTIEVDSFVVLPV